MEQNIKNFVNPTVLRHEGKFSVELTEDADKSMLPRSAEVSGNTVTVKQGRIVQVMGGIQFYASEQPFAWGYPKIKAIRDGSGKLLWVNYDYR